MPGVLNQQLAQELGREMSKLYKITKDPGSFMNSRNTNRIGREFLHAGNTNPDYFSTPRDLPKGSLNEILANINATHGLNGLEALRPTSDRLNGVENRLGLSLNKFGDSLGGVHPRLSSTMDRYRMPDGITRSSQPWFGDTELSMPGTGGKNFYNGAWTAMLAAPGDIVNPTSSLTKINQERRTANMLPMYEKHGDRANRILMSEEQLSDLSSNPNYLRTMNFHQLPPEKQVGLMNSIVGTRAASDVGEAGSMALYNARTSPEGSFAKASYEQRLKDFRDRTGLQPDEPWNPSSSMTEDQTKALASIMHQISRDNNGSDRFSTGFDGLRRAILSNEFYQGAGAQDMPPWLTKGLGRATGGRVPMMAIPPNPRTQGQAQQPLGPLSTFDPSPV